MEIEVKSGLPWVPQNVYTATYRGLVQRVLHKKNPDGSMTDIPGREILIELDFKDSSGKNITLNEFMPDKDGNLSVTPNNKFGKLIGAILGRPLKLGEKLDTNTLLNKQLRVVVKDKREGISHVSEWLPLA